jgi:hypothetical protein
MHGLGGIHFDFGRSLGEVHCATLLVRDIGRRWCQYGLDDPSSANAVVGYVRATAEKVGARRIVCIGNSTCDSPQSCCGDAPAPSPSGGRLG